VGEQWSHLPSQWISKSTKEKIYVIGREDMEESRLLDHNPQPFFLGHHQLGQKLQDLRLKVVESFRKFDYSKYTEHIQAIFSDDFVDLPASGINELFPPPKRGRPRKSESKKRKRQKQDLDYIPINESLHRNLRRRGQKRIATSKAPVVDQSSSDSNKLLNMADILLQARDSKTGTWKIFVEWDDRPLKEASWITITNLPRESLQWWELLRECRYPGFNEDMFPSLAISGDSSRSGDTTVTQALSTSSSSSDSD